MIRRPPLQDAIFDVASWPRDEEYEVYPVGSRPKELLIAPDPVPSSILRAGHHYLFKASSHNYPAQFWAEIIAYRVGLVSGVRVPPAFAAYDSRTGQPGALIEWFYDMRRGSGSERFVHGVDYLKRVIPDFDFKTGRQHNLRTVLSILNLAHRIRGLQLPLLFWARTFAFDSLIGNTDRHQENWGLLWSTAAGGRRPRFAPAFDNGTSLGHEQTEANLRKFTDAAYLARYVGRGRHHMRWELEGDRVGHFAMLERLTEAYPASRRAIRNVAHCSMNDIAAEILSIKRLGGEMGLTAERSAFVLALLQRRHHLLQAFV